MKLVRLVLLKNIQIYSAMINIKVLRVSKQCVRKSNKPLTKDMNDPTIEARKYSIGNERKEKLDELESC